MASSSGSGTSGGSIQEEPEAAVMDLRKRKRMLSNRESARRSRQRKQKHLDELSAQVSQLRKENGQIVGALQATTNQLMGVAAENSVLRTQMVELTNRLQALNEILLSCTTLSSHDDDGFSSCDDEMMMMMMMMKPWIQQPVMASVDMFQYC